MSARELQKAVKEQKRLEKELKEKSINVPATVEIDIEKNCQLRQKAAQAGNESAFKFKVQFEGLGVDFQDFLATLAKIQVDNPETHGRA